MRKRSRLLVAAAVPIGVLALAGCVPATLAPTIVVTPGLGKSAADFGADQTACTAQANQQVGPAIQAANNQLVGNALLGVTPDQTAQSAQSAQVTLQQQYNIAYSQCMYARGENVPGMTPVATEPEPAPVKHRKHYVKKKPAATPASASFVEPAPAPASATASASFVQPAPASSGTSSGFAVPAPAAH